MPRPAFDSLPLNPNDPPFSAWGLYGPDDQLGTLNLLTPEVVTEAAKEIRTGVRVGLNLPLDYLTEPTHGRLALKHTLLPSKGTIAIHDDAVEMNTQCSTQWDGFRHVGYRESGLFYNGTTKEKISGEKATPVLGTHSWCDKGIAGRGILLDYLRWAQSQNKHYDILKNHAITAEDLQACAKAQNVVPREGDILFLRTGFKVGYEALSKEERTEWAHNKPTIWTGIETSAKTARWLWDTGFAAVAGDQPGWEKFPIWTTPDVGGLGDMSLHEVLLGGWAMPIGEYFSLEELGEECARQGRYSFFVTSMPLNVPGGVGSPPSALAIF